MRVPLHNQQARLSGLLEQEGLYEDGEIIMSHPISPERAPAIKSCVDYIRKEKYLKESNEAFGLQVKNIAWNDYYPQTKKDNKKNPPQQKNKVVFAPRHSGIPVEGYKVAYTFTIKKNEAVIKLEDGKERKVNVSPYVRQLMAAQQGVTGNSKVYLDEAYKLDDRSVLYFTEIVVNQTGDSKNYKISGRGFFLQK
jgi:S-adenosylhomocysteine hydrolase